ncbi:MAG: LysE/ArgO family amino acid transporter [Arcanobacterium sp.]|nr:LysE/ArgO family amino acid transporter [Arcanobacterium sp.]
MSTFITGLVSGLSLIIAIGAQNAYLLRQAIIGKYQYAIALFCALSDAVLIGLGVFGFGYVVEKFPMALEVLRWGGVIFLLWYGTQALLRIQESGSLDVDTKTTGPKTLLKALLIAGAMTYLNPHVYLDTIVLLGSIANTVPGNSWLFYFGAITASFSWFFTLAAAGKPLRPIFSKPQAWKILDFLIALLMFFLAAKLAFEF